MSGSLSFIQDVIYGLKNEYPFPGYVAGKTVGETNVLTGAKTLTQAFRIYVPKMIRLPFSWRKFMAIKAKGGIQEVGSQEILVDKSDLRGQALKSGDYIEAEGRRLDVGEVEDYPYAYVLHIKSLEGMPIG